MKITFLFGAGAEGQHQIGMPSGYEFKKDLIAAKQVVPFINAINQSTFPALKFIDGCNLAHNSSGVLYQTLVELQESESECMEKLFPSGRERKSVKAYLDYKKGKPNADKKRKEQITKSFSKLYRKKFWEQLKEGKTTPEVEYFLEHAGIYAYLDELFGYLRKPELYPNQCARVVKIYYSALYSMIKSLCKRSDLYTSEDEILSVLSALDRESLFGFIDELQHKIIEEVQMSQGKPYYKQISDLKSAFKEIEISVINLNYTLFAERLIDLEPEEIAYLHGKLGLFEELKSKKVGMLSELDTNATVFPYLLVQSGVKPIISPHQIREFEKAREWMNSADVVIVIGYGINSDDEHITNLLRWRIDNQKRIICFVYSEGKPEKYEAEKKKIQSQLGTSPYVEFKDTSTFEKVINQIYTGG